jgi:phage FluMu protein Com
VLDKLSAGLYSRRQLEEREMLSTITTDRDGHCHKCGAFLAAGRRVRYGYGRIYCPNTKHGGALTKAEAHTQRVRRQMADNQRAWDQAFGNKRS